MSAASERVLEVPIRRHIIESGRPFASVLDGIFGGISQPDIASLFSELEASPYHDAAVSEVVQRLDTEVLTLVREVTGVPASRTT